MVVVVIIVVAVHVVAVLLLLLPLLILLFFVQATQSATWLCLDSSSMDHAWVQYLPELFGKNKTLTLSNGEHLLMDDTSFKLVFETGSLEQASPAALLNSVCNPYMLARNQILHFCARGGQGGFFKGRSL